MIIQHGGTSDGQITHRYVYGFSAWEKRVLISGIPKQIKKEESAIKKIENNPRNEGQVKYSEAIRERNINISILREIETEFLKDIEEFNARQKNKKDKV